MSSSTSNDTIAISCTSELQALAHGQTHSLLTMASLSAPELPETEQPRAGVDLCALIDRSGSMSGAKIKLVQDTLIFVVNNVLKPADKLSIVTYDNVVETRLQFTKMDSAGKAAAAEVVRGIRVGGATNLSGALLEGLSLMAGRQERNSSSSVLLFTDGMANAGIRDTPGIVNAMGGVMEAAECNVFTFGYGSDHNEDMLRQIAEAGRGLYYYLENNDTIPCAFADCLGGLLSVVAQNLKAEFKRAEGVQLDKVLTQYKHETVGDTTTVQLGDIYSEETRDLLFQISLPQLPQPQQEQAIVQFTLSYFNVLTSQLCSHTTPLTVSRPAETPSGQEVNLVLDEQRNRLRAAEAMELASKLADDGQLEQANKELEKVMHDIKCSPSAANQSELCGNLMQDLSSCQQGFSDDVVYRSWGSKQTKMASACHYQQRSNHVSAAAYSKKSKGAMRAMFQSEMTPTPAPVSAPPSIPETQMAPPSFLNTTPLPQQQVPNLPPPPSNTSSTSRNSLLQRGKMKLSKSKTASPSA